MTAKEMATMHDLRIFISRSSLASGEWRSECSPRISPPGFREGINEERRALRQLRKPGGPYGRDRKEVLLALFVIILDGKVELLKR